MDPVDFLQAVKEESSGGTVVFVGTVRNRSHGKAVASLEYQVYRKLAVKRMEGIESLVRRRWPGVRLSMAHREGKLRVGEVSVVVAASAPHRADAFEACRFAIDRVKTDLPLWKKETEPGGHGSWVEGVPISGTAPMPTSRSKTRARAGR